MVRSKRSKYKRGCRQQCKRCGRFCGFALSHCGRCRSVQRQQGHALFEDVGTSTTSASALVETTVCVICQRVSTVEYPLFFLKTKARLYGPRYFGWFTRRKSVRVLCSQCYAYFVMKKRAWCYAWPAVLYSVLLHHETPLHVRQQIAKYVPNSIKLHWRFWLDLRGTGVEFVADFTRYYIENPLPKSHMVVGEFIEAMDSHTFPKVLCPFGCHICALKDGYGLMAFVHLISYFFAGFDLFGGSSLKMCGCAPSWLHGLRSIGIFESGVLMGGCIIDKVRGLSILTCKDHDMGSSFQVVYPPHNPVLRGLSLCTPDNTALATVKPRVIKHIRTGFLSGTWGLYNAQESSTGLSSFALTSDKRWDHISAMVASVDALVTRHRADIVYDMYLRVTGGGMRGPVLASVLRAAAASPEIHASDDLLRSTLVDPKDAVLMRERSRSLKASRDPPHVFYAHCYGAHGARPVTPPIWMLQKKVGKSFDAIRIFIWVLLLWSVVSNGFVSDFVDAVSKMGTCGIWNRKCTEQFRAVLEGLASFDETKRKAVRKSLRLLELSITTRLWEEVAQSLPAILHHTPYVVVRMFVMLVQSVHLCGVVVSSGGNVSYLAGDLQSSQSVFAVKERTNVASLCIPLSAMTSGPNGRELVGAVCMSNALRLPEAYVRHGGTRKCWWFVPYGQHPTACNHEFETSTFPDIHDWQICLYSGNQYVTQQQFTDSLMHVLKGQTILHCSVHKILLIKEEYPARVCCSQIKCTQYPHKALYSCPFRQSCGVSICRRHYVELMQAADQSICPIYVKNRYHLQSASTFTTSSSVSCRSVISHDGNAATTSDNSAASSRGVSFDHDSDLNSLSESEPDVKLYTNVCDTPLGIESFTVSGVFLINHVCGVLRRRGYPSNLPRYAQRYFQNIVSLSQSGVGLPLLFPESLLFTSIFWKMLSYPTGEKSYPGALPISLYSSMSNRRYGFRSFRDHCVMRLRDWSCPTSSSSNYALFMFDVCLNQMLNSTTRSVILKRGWEHIAGDQMEVPISHREKYIAYDSADSRRNVRELSALISKACPRYFVTLTANQHGTPCLRRITEAREVFLQNHREVPETVAFQASCTPYLTVWYSFVCSFMEFLYHGGDDDIFGKVDCYWMRFEWQSAESSLPHCHILIWSSESTAVSKTRIVCSLKQFCSFKDKLFHKNLIRSEAEWEDVCAAYFLLQRHLCSQSKGRCLKRGEDGTLHCRVASYTSSSTTEYIPIDRSLSAEELSTYIELGWAKKELGGTYTISPEWQPGRWSYATDGLHQWSPVSPYIFCIFRSSCNVQLVDFTMAARYLASYAAGAEEHIRTRLRATGPTSTEVVIGNLENIKLSGGRAQKKRSEKEIQGRILSLPEAIFYIMRLRYVVTSAAFVHVRTDPSDERPVVKLNKNRVEARDHATGFHIPQVDVRRDLPDI